MSGKLLRCGPHHQTLVDDDFIPPGEMNLQFSNGYAKIHYLKHVGLKPTGLHRYIMGLTQDSEYEVDHINRNRLDNRIENLRKCTRRQNASNIPGKGACFVGTRKRWMAYARMPGVTKNILLGYFKTEAEAISAANAYKLKTRGEFACLWPSITEPLPLAL